MTMDNSPHEGGNEEFMRVWKSLTKHEALKNGGGQSIPGEGVVYTRPRLVNCCLDIVERVYGGELCRATILDVGCGYGQFISMIAYRIASRCKKDGRSLEDLQQTLGESLRGIEVRKPTSDIARKIIRRAVSKVYGDTLGDAALRKIVVTDDFLTWDPAPKKYDVIVGNLPYVRYDNIPNLGHSPSRERLGVTYKVFNGRADYSVPFLARIHDILEESGVAVILASNRFTRARYGRSLREKFAKSKIAIDEVDLGGLRVFEDQVTAYASIFVLRCREQARSKYIRLESGSLGVLRQVSRQFPNVNGEEDGFSVIERNIDDYGAGPWSPLTSRMTKILRGLESRCDTLEDLGAVVRKGPATGANDVFIGSKSEFPIGKESTDQYLLPLFHWNGSSNGDTTDRFLLCPYERGSGRLKDLSEMPEDVREFLRDNAERLKQRYIVKERGHDWWGMIDAFDPSLLEREKILVPDLRPAEDVWLDPGQFIPSHSTVYVTGLSSDRLRGLCRVLRSSLAEQYRRWKSPDLGRKCPRASSTMLRKMPVPSGEKLEGLAKKGMENIGVGEAYGLDDTDIIVCEQ